MCNIKGIIYHIIRLIKILVKEYFTNRKIRRYIKDKIRSTLKCIKELSLLQDFQKHKKKMKKKEKKKIKGEFLKN